MLQRALRALQGTNYGPDSKVGLLVDYAAQGPRLEYGDYGELALYNQELRRITRAWGEVRRFAWECHLAGVTDADIDRVIPIAFSGRVEIKGGQVGYCTGQYWPTEYRAAVAAVLDAAVRCALARRAS